MIATNNNDYYDAYKPVCDYTTWELLPETKSFSILCINIRSLSGKFAELQALIGLSPNKFHALIVVETWLTDSNDTLFNIEGFQSFSLNRSCSIGGGVKIYIESSLHTEPITNLTKEYPECESLFLKINLPLLPLIWLYLSTLACIKQLA